MTETQASRDRLGTALVAAQLVLIVVLAVLAAPPFLQGRAPAVAWLLAAAGALLGLWALAHNRPGNFNIRPAPRDGGQWVHTGPYRWIRHPMYTAVMACGCACAWAAGSVWGWCAALALVAVLGTKAYFEERWMLQQHPGYAAYRQRTRRFLPFVI
ncbi:MAG: isoprenylcysteine carboxylmethyltransferase family protein [Rubrivivax sp.]|nr:isoprenylcysteine carboxylmethyltransferase family protein [Rubrivivax sp.]